MAIQVDPNYKVALGKRIKEVREKFFGIEEEKQKDCARRMGVSPQSLSNYEAGRTDLSSGRLAEIAAFFEVRIPGFDARWLLTGRGSMIREEGPKTDAARQDKVAEELEEYGGKRREN
jgi:transcriptional regulator with XRE-family HTH domain